MILFFKIIMDWSEVYTSRLVKVILDYTLRQHGDCKDETCRNPLVQVLYIKKGPYGARIPQPLLSLYQIFGGRTKNTVCP